jgi:predicted  nucleic acid-binding Zn-ribbon protein
MSFLVLHMDKFKKEAVRGIQSHNRRERESHSNPDIDYARSQGNFDLCEPAAESYTGAIQSRIDDLLLVKAVRKDAVHMCGLIVTSDSEFFQKLSPKDTRRFFEESKAFLTEFVGEKNVVSAMVHLDEKTPHMHFLHVPVTSDGRLNANAIYTRESLKKLQTELPRYLQSKDFDLQRGIEQVPGAAKKHLDTREYKQQREAVHDLQREAETVRQQVQSIKTALEQGKQEEAALQERLQSCERLAKEAEKVLRADYGIPEVNVFTYKKAMQKAHFMIAQLEKALADQKIVETLKRYSEAEVKKLRERVESLEAAKTQEEKRSLDAIGKILKQHEKTCAELEGYRNFANQPEISPLHIAYLQERREFARRKEAEQKALERERQEAQQRKEELERQQERQREQESQKALELVWGRRGMGMGL